MDALRAELDRAADDEAREGLVEAFRARLTVTGTPIVEAGDADGWCLVTFVWFGVAPHGVVLQLNRFADPLDLEDTLLEPVAGTDLHALTLRLPDDWLGSYYFVPLPQRVPPTLHAAVDMRVRASLAECAQADPLAAEPIPGKPAPGSTLIPGELAPGSTLIPGELAPGSTLIPGELAPGSTLIPGKPTPGPAPIPGKPTPGPTGRMMPAHAAARGPAASRAALWRHDPVPTAELPSVVSPGNGASLGFHHHALAGADETSPVILLGDGEVWREQFVLAAELERRREAGEFPAAHLLFLESGGPKQRQLDYTADAEATCALMAAAREAAAPVVPDAPWIVAGQSLSGLFAATVATRHPERVCAAVAQSPSLWWPGPVSPWEHPVGWFEERAMLGGSPILLEAGAIDAGIVERCQPAAALLRAQGSLIDYRVHTSGHDVLRWQATLPDALRVTIASVHAL